MRHFTRSLSADIVIALALLAFQQPASQGTSTEKKSSGTVTGRVSLEGEPVSGAKVALIPDRGSLDRVPTADRKATVSAKDGTFQLTGVPSGTFLLTVSSPVGTLPSEPGREAGKLIAVGESSVVDVDLSLIRGGVITGRIMLSNGLPRVAHRVEAIPSSPSSTSYPTSAETDDRGVYRMFNLPPGNYLVAAVPVEVPAGGDRLFYPGGTDRKRATPVNVTSGGEVTDVDITIENVAGYNAQGQVLDGDSGMPVASVRVVCVRTTGEFRQSFSDKSDEKGRFTLRDLRPGKYRLSLSRAENSDQYGDAIEFEITDANVVGLSITTLRGTPISGIVVLEGEIPAGGTRDFSSLRVSAFRSGVNYSDSNGAGVNADGSFRISGLGPGRHFVNVSSRSEPWCRLIRVEGSGVIREREVEISPGQPISGLRLITPCGRGRVFGQVRTPNGQLPDGSRLDVSLEPVDSRMVGPGQSEPVSATGQFRFDFVTPGSYYLVTRLLPAPTSRTRFPAVRQPITVRNREDTEVNVVLDLSPAK